MENVFKAGRTYWTRSSCNHESIYEYTVICRTAKTITLEEFAKEKGRRKVSIGTDGIETCRPEGRYSMAPMIRAGRYYEEVDINDDDGSEDILDGVFEETDTISDFPEKIELIEKEEESHDLCLESIDLVENETDASEEESHGWEELELLECRPEPEDREMEQLKTAFQKHCGNTNSAKIHLVRSEVGWPRKKFDSWIEKLAFGGAIKIDEADMDEIKKKFTCDQVIASFVAPVRGTVYTRMSWVKA